MRNWDQGGDRSIECWSLMPKTLRSPQQTLLQKLLIEARISRNLTQDEVADRLGRPQSFVSKYETGERRLDVIEYCDVVRALGADPVELLAELLGQSRHGRGERSQVPS